MSTTLDWFHAAGGQPLSVKITGEPKHGATRGGLISTVGGSAEVY